MLLTIVNRLEIQLKINLVLVLREIGFLDMCRSFYFSFILNFIFGLLAWYSRCESHQKDVPPLSQSLDIKPFPVKQYELGAIANSDIQKKKLCIFQYDTRGRSDPITNEATRRVIFK